MDVPVLASTRDMGFPIRDGVSKIQDLSKEELVNLFGNILRRLDKKYGWTKDTLSAATKGSIIVRNMKDIGLRDVFQTAKDVAPQNAAFVGRALSGLMDTLSKKVPQRQTPSRTPRRETSKTPSGTPKRSKEKENTRKEKKHIATELGDDPFAKKTHLPRTPPIQSRPQPMDDDDDDLHKSPMQMDDEASMAFGIAMRTQKLQRTPLGQISRPFHAFEEPDKLQIDRSRIVGVDDDGVDHDDDDDGRRRGDDDESTPPSSPALSSESSSASMTLSPPEIDVQQQSPPHSSPPLPSVETEKTQDLPPSTPTDHSRIRVSAKKPPLTPKSVRRNQLAQSGLSFSPPIRRRIPGERLARTPPAGKKVGGFQVESVMYADENAIPDDMIVDMDLDVDEDEDVDVDVDEDVDVDADSDTHMGDDSDDEDEEKTRESENMRSVTSTSDEIAVRGDATYLKESRLHAEQELALEESEMLEKKIKDSKDRQELLLAQIEKIDGDIHAMQAEQEKMLIVLQEHGLSPAKDGKEKASLKRTLREALRNAQQMTDQIRETMNQRSQELELQFAKIHDAVSCEMEQIDTLQPLVDEGKREITNAWRRLQDRRKLIENDCAKVIQDAEDRVVEIQKRKERLQKELTSSALERKRLPRRGYRIEAQKAEEELIKNRLWMYAKREKDLSIVDDILQDLCAL